MKLMPGQVWWNGDLGIRAIVHSIEGKGTRVVLLSQKKARPIQSMTWKGDPPKGYHLIYEPSDK